MRTSVKVRVLMLTAIVALMGTHVQGSGGAFMFALDLGHSELIGGVPEGATINVELLSANMIDINLTCPLKATLFMVRVNNSAGIKKKTIRKNITTSEFSLKAPFDGEAFLVVQTQSISDICAGLAVIVVDLTTIGIAQTGNNQSVELDVPTGTNVFGSRLELAKEADEVTADEPIPADVTDPRLIQLYERHNR